MIIETILISLAGLIVMVASKLALKKSTCISNCCDTITEKYDDT